MSVPGFTAHTSLYRTRGWYRGSAMAPGVLTSETIIPAYRPGPETQAACSRCNERCATTLAECTLLAAAPLLACVIPPLCPGAVATSAALLTGCLKLNGICVGRCFTTTCCPNFCGDFFELNPFEPGEGCCDVGERCVDKSDPNSRRGCCPSGQLVCGGRCCAPGERCCGSQCCPPSWFCMPDGTCTQSPGFPITPPPTPPLPKTFCRAGWTPCDGECCEPGLECCPDRVCRRHCLH